ncbi:MAG TPA: hypothetical protein VK528_00770 [Flavobacterium sp.]|nr:hypothetical protein [Flavobacterium sp.]
MKKTVVLIAVLLGIVSCEPKVESFNKIENLQKLIRQKELKNPLLMMVAKNSISFSTVVIKRNPATELWLEEMATATVKNSDLKYIERPNQYFMDLDLIKDVNARAQWLEDNSDKIDYDETAKYVENSHRIHYPELIDGLYKKNEADFKKVKVGVLKAAIGGDYQYPNYIEFDLSGATAVPNKVKKYSTDPQLFSCLTLKSLIESHKLDDNNDYIGVAVIPLYPHDFTCIKIIGVEAYYNYSNEPR